MRLWSVHPRQLDRAALVACWREGLLAQKVLAGETRGYRNHPQLDRFKQFADPVAAVATYLHGVADEADARGYRFDRTRLRADADPTLRCPVTDGQLAYEWAHLRAKVGGRDPDALPRLGAGPDAHPLFEVVPGPVAAWERP